MIEPLHPLQQLLRRGLMQAGRVFDPVLTVKGILRLVAGEPPLVGGLIQSVGPELLGHLVCHFNELVRYVPRVKFP